MSVVPRRIDFRAYTQHVPPNIPIAIQRATTRLVASRAAAVAHVPEWESLRQVAHDLRLHALDHLDELISQVEHRVGEAGGTVHRARDAAQACAIVVDIARRHRVKAVVKGKSMATEEIGLNHAFEQVGVRAIETDVGELIVQIAGVGPSHILGPATHMTKEEIAALFTQKLGIDAPPDPRRLTDIAHAYLREHFLRAEMGITGANFVIAETGTVVLVTNEGNGRMCTTLPDIYVAVAGIDKIISDWNSLATLLPLLVRSATGQKMSCCTSFLSGPSRTARESGPREFHLVLLDNGRTLIRQDSVARETLLCIRCAACLNICPVYNQAGGHAYGWVYSGPIGAILSPQLLGMRVARDLPFASTLCGACADVCPVKIPIPKILLHLRRRAAEGNVTESPVIAWRIRLVAKLGSIVLRTPWLYRLGSQLLRIAQMPLNRDDWLHALPPVSRWTQTRSFPAFNARFRKWWKGRNPKFEIRNSKFKVEQTEHAPSSTQVTARTPEARLNDMDALLNEIVRLGGNARRVGAQELDKALQTLVETEGIQSATLWATEGIARLDLVRRLRAHGVEIIPHDADKFTLAKVDLGITEADFALAESGTLGLLSSPEKPRTLSLLPRVHLAIVNPTALRADLRQVIGEAKTENYFVFITGPSRTSDIEANPVLGVHGPKSLQVWAIN